MRTIHRIFTTIKVGLTVLIGLTLSLYTIGYAVNLRDEAPSDDYLRIIKIQQSQPDIRDEENAFIYMAGVNALTPAKMLDEGRKWRDSNTDEDYATPKDIHAELRAHFPDLPECKSLTCEVDVADIRSIVREWKLLQPDLDERYQNLLARSKFKYPVRHINAKMFMYFMALLDLQKQYLLSVFSNSLSLSSVKNRLHEDSEFWRNILNQSNNWLMTHVSIHALKRNLLWGYQLKKSTKT